MFQTSILHELCLQMGPNHQNVFKNQIFGLNKLYQVNEIVSKTEIYTSSMTRWQRDRADIKNPEQRQVAQLVFYIYKRLCPRKKNPQQKKRKSRQINFFYEIEHQTC